MNTMITTNTMIIISIIPNTMIDIHQVRGIHLLVLFVPIHQIGSIQLMAFVHSYSPDKRYSPVGTCSYSPDRRRYSPDNRYSPESNDNRYSPESNGRYSPTSNRRYSPTNKTYSPTSRRYSPDSKRRYSPDSIRRYSPDSNMRYSPDSNRMYSPAANRSYSPDNRYTPDNKYIPDQYNPTRKSFFQNRNHHNINNNNHHSNNNYKKTNDNEYRHQIDRRYSPDIIDNRNRHSNNRNRHSNNTNTNNNNNIIYNNQSFETSPTDYDFNTTIPIDSPSNSTDASSSSSISNSSVVNYSTNISSSLKLPHFHTMYKKSLTKMTTQSKPKNKNSSKNILSNNNLKEETYLQSYMSIIDNLKSSEKTKSNPFPPPFAEQTLNIIHSTNQSKKLRSIQSIHKIERNPISQIYRIRGLSRHTHYSSTPSIDQQLESIHDSTIHTSIIKNNEFHSSTNFHIINHGCKTNSYVVNEFLENLSSRLNNIFPLLLKVLTYESSRNILKLDVTFTRANPLLFSKNRSTLNNNVQPCLKHLPSKEDLDSSALTELASIMHDLYATICTDNINPETDPLRFMFRQGMASSLGLSEQNIIQFCESLTVGCNMFIKPHQDTLNPHQYDIDDSISLCTNFTITRSINDDKELKEKIMKLLCLNENKKKL